MKKFICFIDCYTPKRYIVEAETREEAEDKAQEIIDCENFFEEYRKDCDFFEPTVSDYIEDVHEC